MTEQDAIALAAKREKHKPKSMTHKQWEAKHDSIKGWHVALVDKISPTIKPKDMLPPNLVAIGIAAQLFGTRATAMALHRIAAERATAK